MEFLKKIFVFTMLLFLPSGNLCYAESKTLDKVYESSNINSTYTIEEKVIEQEHEFYKAKIRYPHLKIDEKLIKEESYNPLFIQKINNDISTYVTAFEEDIEKQSKEYEQYYKENKDKEQIKYQYEAYSKYGIAYNKNNYLSIPLLTYQFTGGAHGISYLKSFNYDLYNQKELTLKDCFKEDVDYKKIVNTFIKSEIEKQPELYFDGSGGIAGFTSISDNQDFYVSEDGIVVYFQLYDISPYYVGIPQFTMTYDEFRNVLK